VIQKATFSREPTSGGNGKRLPIAIVVHLAQLHSDAANGAEVAYTDNISAHGACLISSRPWKLGEVVEVTPLKDQIPLCGKVAHCERRDDHRYAIGLAFQGCRVTWSTYRTYTGAA
jgi:hypothetical protein